METKFDSRHGQFPATFPDSFKNFFAIMSEDEDQLNLFSNLLEDKIIPKNKFNQRCCGGSLRCSDTHSHTTVGRVDDKNVRANSFRIIRDRVSTGSRFVSTPKLNANGSANSEVGDAEGVVDGSNFRPQNSISKHVQYCCLQKHPQNHQNCGSDQQSSALYVEVKRDFDYSLDTSSGIDSEGNEASALSAPEANNDQQQYPRYSIISKRPSDFGDSSFNEMDIQSSSTTAPMSNNKPYRVLTRLLPILKQPHQQQQQHFPVIQAQPQPTIRTLPQPPKNFGAGVFHSKETALQRIQQQCRLSSRQKADSGTSNGSSGSSKNNITRSIASTDTLKATDRHGDNMCNTNGSTSTQILTKPSVMSATESNKFNNTLANEKNGTISSNLSQKSPILAPRRSSNNFHASDFSSNYKNLIQEDVMLNHTAIWHTSKTREHITHVNAMSPVASKPNRIPVEGGVLTFKQVMSGAVSPQYSVTSAVMLADSEADMESEKDLQELPRSKRIAASSASKHDDHIGPSVGGLVDAIDNKQRQRLRTSSMPAESRKPRLVETRRAAIHCADIDLEYYRLRSFSITSHGICNLGDSLRSRRSRSINSVTSTATSNSGRDRHNSNASRTSGEIIVDLAGKTQIPIYKIAMLGASGVGKTTLTYQFTTSDYICAYDLSLDDDYGQKTVSVLVDDSETDLEIIDHPACEMSTEAFCSTYNVDLFVVVYSVVDRSSFKTAEKVLQYLKENEMLLTRGAILVGNKTDLERHREVNRQMGRKVAKDIACKFIETSSGIVHNVDELLVGIVAQVKLNPQRIRKMSDYDRKRLNLQSTIQKHRFHAVHRSIVRQHSMCQAEEEEDISEGEDVQREGCQVHNKSHHTTFDEDIFSEGNSNACTTTISIKTSTRKTNKRTLNLESILKMGESEQEDEDENAGRLRKHLSQPRRPLSKFDLLTSGRTEAAAAGGVRTPFGSINSSPKSRQSYEANSCGSECIRATGHNSSDAAISSGSRYQDSASTAEENLLPNCNRKTVTKLKNRTKVFLSSVMRFRKAINAKRSTSSSCSDLFVI